MTSDEAFDNALVDRCKTVVTVPQDFEAGWSAALEWAKSGQEPVAWCIEAKDSADWCFSKTKEGVRLNAVLMDADCNLTEPFEIYTHPAPAQPVRLSDYELWQSTEVMESNATTGLPMAALLILANSVQDAMLAKGAAQPAVVQQLLSLLECINRVSCTLPPSIRHEIEAALKAVKGENL